MTYKNLRTYFFSLLFLPAFSSAADITEINGKLPSMGIGSSYISGPGVTNKEVIYHNINGLAVFEGDIVLGTVEQATQLALKQANINSEMTSKSIFLDPADFQWPNNIIPYEFSTGVSNEVIAIVNRAADHWNNNTEVRFILRTPNNADQFPNFVSIIDNAVACWSFVGMRGAEQQVNIAVECGVGSTIHEFGHVVGLWHEHSREDRDQFVTINTQNIRANQVTSFSQHITDGIDIGAYDYGSIMHYRRNAFGIVDPLTNIAAETITPTQVGAVIGQRDGLSPLDIASILQYYPVQAITTARLAANDVTTIVGDSINFDASSSTGVALSYQFDSGDGTLQTLTTGSFSHIYTVPGHYTMTLIVTDILGNTATTSATIHVSLSRTQAVLFIDQQIYLGNFAYIDASASIGDIVFYELQLGDGSYQYLTHPHYRHRYLSPGLFFVKLKVTSSTGESSITTRTIRVR